MEVCNTIDLKTLSVYEFLEDPILKLLVIIGEGGSGKSLGTNTAIQEYEKTDPDIRKKLHIIYEHNGKLIPHKNKKTIVHMYKLNAEKISQLITHDYVEFVEFVEFVRGEEPS